MESELGAGRESGVKQVCSQLESSFGRTGVRVGKVSFEREKCE